MSKPDDSVNTNRPLPIPFQANRSRHTLRITPKILTSFFCAMLASLVLVICALDKLDTLLQSGIQSVICNLTLGKSTPLSESVFGSPALQSVSLPSSYLTLPRIYYIPRESIIDDSLIKAKELEKKMFDLYAFDYSKVPKNAYPIVPTDLSVTDYLTLKNDTSFNVDMKKAEELALAREKEIITDEPLVLIVHTHGTEAFSEDGTPFYRDGYNVPRSEDPSKNAVAVGKVLAEALNKKGIPTVQCETMHDKESYVSAYDRSGESIKHYLEKYPSIKYVFDVHRDSLVQSDLTKLRPVTIHSGEPCAQIMMIIGSSEKSGIDYSWEENLVLATAIQKQLSDNTLGVARQLYLRGATYNQQHSRYGLLLEIGSCGNTVSECKNAARVFADAFASVIK